MAQRITLGGRDREIRYPMTALDRLKEEHGVDLMGGDEDEWDFADPKKVSAIVWAGLLHAEPDLTLDAVMAELELRDLPAVTDALGKEFSGKAVNPPVAPESA